MGRVRSTVARHRVPWPRRLLMDPVALRYWALAVVAALAVSVVVARSLAAADAARAGWGRSTPVVVATASVEAGDALDGSVRVEQWPRALAPSDVAPELPRGARAKVALGPGTPITAALLEGEAGGDPTDGRRSIALPLGPDRLPVERGDRVDVWGSVDPGLSPAGTATRRVATGAIVVAATEQLVVVAVDPAEVAEVAEAVAIAALTLVGTS